MANSPSLPPLLEPIVVMWYVTRLQYYRQWYHVYGFTYHIKRNTWEQININWTEQMQAGGESLTHGYCRPSSAANVRHVLTPVSSDRSLQQYRTHFRRASGSCQPPPRRNPQSSKPTQGTHTWPHDLQTSISELLFMDLKSSQTFFWHYHKVNY